MQSKYPLLITLATLAIIGGLLASTKNKTLTHLTPSLTTSEAGFNDIVIQARGTNNKEKIALYINNTPVTFWNLSNNFKDYTYTPNGEITVSELSIHFLNDTWEPENNINYDVQIPYITVNGTTYNSEHSSTVSTGSWDQDNWCAPGNKQTQWLNCNGSFTYNIPVGTVVGLPTTNPICGNNQIEEGEQCDDGNVASGDGCSSACITESAGPLSGIIFETNFDNDTGYQVVGGIGFGSDKAPPPAGWDAIRANDGMIDVVPEGVNDSNALRLSFREISGRASITLAKHLTGDFATGYPELYVRYNLKLPPNFRAGTGNGGPFWKWGRLWQNTTPEVGPTWTEKRDDAGYAIWGLGSDFQGMKGMYGVFSDNETALGNPELGSNGGPLQQVTWRDSGDVTKLPGKFESVGDGAWALDDNGFLINRNQQYHTFEWRVKIASSAEAGDGIYELWFDGVSQGPYKQFRSLYGAPDRTGIATEAEVSGGFNHLSVFDNMQGWAEDWSSENVDGYILINDVVVSTEPIGHDYVAGNTDNVPK